MTSDNPYQAPAAELTEHEIPNEYNTGGITASQLRIAAWLSITYIILGIPLTWVSFQPDTFPTSAYIALTLVTSAIFIYLIWTLRSFVILRFRYTKLNTYVYLLILLTIITSLQAIFIDNSLEDGLSPAYITYLIILPIYGIVSILFGLKLKKIHSSYKHLNNLGMLSIISGVCMATIILALLAVFFTFVWNILLALLFFEAARELESISN